MVPLAKRFLTIFLSVGSPPRSSAAFGHSAIRLQQGFQFAADPRSNRALAINGPGEHGATVEVLDQTGQLRGIAFPKFSRGDGFLEKFSSFLANGEELRESDGVEFRVSKINLEVGQAVGHGFGRGRERSAFRVQLDERREGRFVFCAGGRELLWNTTWGGAAQR